jgi:alkylation response protein AidB-like acyl-CoA dehydrogenase
MLTEAHSGSDAASMRTTAVLQGNQYVVNDPNIFIAKRMSVVTRSCAWQHRHGELPATLGVPCVFAGKRMPGIASSARRVTVQVPWQERAATRPCQAV